ncbi:MAG: FAD-dependent oxidoreductase [Alphaproteobacteria bacterium]|nr:FAD-dependent oxidoreductase [Alphaproteobacteria bacterium]
MTEAVDVAVIGAGVVGIAIARALALEGREVVLLERNDKVGAETSSRNSEVIHAGIYYRPGGLRARLCRPGKELLYRYCAERGVAHKRCGKLIVATSDAEVSRLENLRRTAEQNGVSDLELISGEKAAELEPGLCARAALLSPTSGVVDGHNLMTSLLGDFENAGGTLALLSPAEGGAVVGDGVRLDIGGAEPTALHARLVVNAAGLWADQVARSISGLAPEWIPQIRPAKGQYFMYSGPAPFGRLIYPLHSPDSQGVHYTRDLGGQARLGPDISWDSPLGDYSVDEDRLSAFAEAARRFWPDIDPARLHPGYAGQRPKTAGPGEEGDFRIYGPKTHGAPGYIGLYGIESPGLTSCLAIADHVAALAR